MKKGLGYGMVTVGFLGAALVSVRNVETLTWAHYAICLGLGITGVFLVRSHMHAERSSQHTLAGNMKSLVDSMTRVVQGCGTYQGQTLTHDTCLAMHGTIDRVFVQDLRIFADARESISHLYGLQTYADIMSHFATGERYLNRVWSASADGYVDEVALYMPQVQEQFTQCLDKLKNLTLKD
ncbi:MAG: hypothetical protein K9N55_13925 [Phycisphaerae bacterium]|nr:hypothetical protein [Phycisphaerae bacterium]